MGARYFSGRHWIGRAIVASMTLTAIVAAHAAVFAQETKRLFEREPFDRITCTQAFDGDVIEVLPIPFPKRRVPKVHKPGDKLPVQEVNGEKPQEIAWVAIEKIDLFEQMVLTEANNLVTAGKLDEAFDFFAFLKLHPSYKEMDGLAA